MNLKKNYLLVCLIFIYNSSSFSQNEIDCSKIQCDCENIDESKSTQGEIDLCKYHQKKLIKKCEKGIKELKCRDDAKGPNAWEKQVLIKKKKEDDIIRVDTAFDTVESLLNEIRNSERSVEKYSELQSRLKALGNKSSGLYLAIEIANLLETINSPAIDISANFGVARYFSGYDKFAIDLFLAKFIPSLSAISKIEIDQIDVKYKLGLLFKRLKIQGFDLYEMFKVGSHRYEVDVLDFIIECNAIVSMNYSSAYLKDLRKTSSRIYLKKMNRLIPSPNRKSLSKPVRLFCDYILDWNEDLLNEAINGLEVITRNTENKNWNKNEINLVYEANSDILNDDHWNNKKYGDALNEVSDELPIVWDLLKAIYLNK